MTGVNARGTDGCTQACLPELIKSAPAGRKPQVLNLPRRISMRDHWFAPHARDPGRRCAPDPDQRRDDGDRLFFIDDDLLALHGVTDLDRYAVVPGTTDRIPDCFVD